jgi:hypothetical protein
MLSLQLLAAATCPTGQTAAPSNISFSCVWAAGGGGAADGKKQGRRRRNKLSRLRTDAEARACDGVCAWTVRPHKDGELLIEREGISKLGGAKDLGSWMRAKEGGAAAREKAGRLW